jgi:VPDSG-CTERM motif
MKLSKYLFAIAALTVALTLSAKADLMFLGAVPKGANNSPSSNHDALQTFLGFDPGALSSNFENGLSGPVSVTPGEYFVVHYGKGKGGSAKGGSWEFFQVINSETSVTFPQNGNEAGNDPFGHGGISSARGFGGSQPPPVPDSGTTVMLLGGALTGLGLLRRYMKR